MASQITTTSFYDGVNESPIDSSTQPDMPIFGIDTEVYLITDFPAQGVPAATPIPANKKYRVINHPPMAGDNAGATVNLDQSLDPATPADGVTLRAAAQNPGQQSFNHTTATPSGTTAATVVSRPWFYDIVEVGNERNVRRGVHQSLLTDAAGIQVYIAAQLPAWVP